MKDRERIIKLLIAKSWKLTEEGKLNLSNKINEFLLIEANKWIDSVYEQILEISKKTKGEKNGSEE